LSALAFSLIFSQYHGACVIKYKLTKDIEERFEEGRKETYSNSYNYKLFIKM